MAGYYFRRSNHRGPESADELAIILHEAKRLLDWAGSVERFIETGDVPESLHEGGGTGPGEHDWWFTRQKIGFVVDGPAHSDVHSERWLWASLSWPQVRKELAKAREPRQMELAL